MNVITKNIKTPVGELILGSFDEKLCLADWRYRKMRTTIDRRIQTGLNSKYETGTSSIIEEAETQLAEYFSGNKIRFTLPLLCIGTDFQKKVWAALIQIPYGETETYLGLSKRLGNQKAIRAVAAANGAIAISILVPCHRIIGSDGRLVGYAGGLPAKEKLLTLENPARTLQMKLF